MRTNLHFNVLTQVGDKTANHWGNYTQMEISYTLNKPLKTQSQGTSSLQDQVLQTHISRIKKKFFLQHIKTRL